MIDTTGRQIDYLRISVTDRCNMRCRYCMPRGVEEIRHEDVLRYEEILTICEAAIQCGITKFKITGGEPFVRKGVVDFMAALGAFPGVTSLTVTTNGLLLPQYLPALQRIGIGGINISLDSLDRQQFRELTGTDALPAVLAAVDAAAASPIPVKINAVLLDDTKGQVLPLAALAQEKNVDVRFIELMPIGCGRQEKGYGQDEVLAVLRAAYPDLALSKERRGNGPATYYASRFLKGRVGFISANTHAFCRQCNRLRLTSTGFLKPCLCYDDGVDLRAIVRSGPPNQTIPALARAIQKAVRQKPAAHQFDNMAAVTEDKTMNRIGG